MQRTIALLFGVAVLSLSTLHADARDGCGAGWYYDGRGCVPNGERRYSPYAPPMYAPPRGYYRRDYDEDRAIRPTMGDNGAISCGNPNYTWQDGACRPYRGR